MRDDMARVVTERPRRGHGNKSRKTTGRPIRSYDPDRDYDEPTRLPVARGRQYGYDCKEFSDLINPLRRYLRSCVGKSWAKVQDFTWNVVAPKKVDRGADLVFRVELKTSDGQSMEELSFWWQVDWVGLKGTQHKGKSFRDQSIRVKGDLGTATLRVFGQDEAGNWAQAAKVSIEVE